MMVNLLFKNEIAITYLSNFISGNIKTHILIVTDF